MCVWCRVVFRVIWQEIWRPFFDWWQRQMRTCSQGRCQWWCLCCNKWFCWIMMIIVLVIVLIFLLIATIVGAVVCGLCVLVCFILCIVFVIFENTPFRNCLDWCGSGRLAEWETEDPVDPQEPSVDNPPITWPPGDGGLSGRSALPIKTLRDLEFVTSWRTVIKRPFAVRLNLGMTIADQLDRQNTINRLLSECGCKEGALLMAVAASAFTMRWIYLGGGGSWSAVLTGFGVCLTAALVGKVCGLVYAQHRLSSMVAQMKSNAS